MATLASNYLTYADYARRLEPGGKLAQIVNLLSQTNEILDDAIVREGNLPTGHQTSVRTGLPQATWRQMNYGVQPTKSTTAQVTDACGFLEAFSDMDERLAELNGMAPEVRLSEDVAFLEGMNQQVANALFYSNALTQPAQIMGLAPRYNTLIAANAQTAYNVIDAGGTGSTNTSMWLVVWGPGKVFLTFPKGGMGGFRQIDLGKAPLYDASGTRMVYRTQFKWDLGMVVQDWRYVVRVVNIDVTQLLSGNAANLINALIRAMGRVPTMPRSATNVQDSDAVGGMPMMGGKTAIYANRLITTALRLQSINKPNSWLSPDTIEGRPVTTFSGIPIRTVDQILNTEARVV